MPWFFQKSVFRFEGWFHLGEFWRVWIVAIHAIVLGLGATTQVPMSIHTSMCVMLESAHLGAMTLGTQCHHFGILDASFVGQFQCVVVFCIVT